MALITAASDPTLYAKLLVEVTKYDTPSGWVVYESLHYRVIQDSSGDTAFEPHDSVETAKSTSF